MITVIRLGFLSNLGWVSTDDVCVEAVREGVAMPQHPVSGRMSPMIIAECDGDAAIGQCLADWIGRWSKNTTRQCGGEQARTQVFSAFQLQ
jgi:hypothetical protein